MNARDMIKRHEGLRLNKYRDSEGNWTIGYGHLILDGERMPDAITIAEAENLFEGDYQDAYQLCERFIPDWSVLSDIRKAVLTDMAFNLGHRLLGFKRMFFYLEMHDYLSVSMEMLDSKWAEQVGERAQELSKLMFYNLEGVV